jgi:hypothetical protein
MVLHEQLLVLMARKRMLLEACPEPSSRLKEIKFHVPSSSCAAYDMHLLDGWQTGMFHL